MPHRVVYFELVKKIEKKRERKYFVQHFWTIIHGENFFTKNDSLFNVVVCCVAVVRGAKLFSFGGSCVLLLLLLLYLHESYRDKFLMLVCVHV